MSTVSLSYGKIIHIAKVDTLRRMREVEAESNDLAEIETHFVG